ncbi:uncharacterized protein BCR38DRAFT_417431 [Pseudomassariella vexata]|uniref:Uncharacterized protein n=1 Tax=Pseudomassariella vexata TaxID=1141098 RepID=A0A1Y2EJ25_9PEZI|nr:uncharacterized protein BCR38DRAFT_417431 [Pseudomassariella vexata]ORY71582.1 hypothetical protein BCR38DRAFT_417431 [Pseudomassariella vexata]
MMKCIGVQECRVGIDPREGTCKKALGAHPHSCGVLGYYDRYRWHDDISTCISI